MKFNVLPFLALLLVFTSCTILGSDSTKSQIVGEWEWIKSTGGFAGHTVTQDSTGYSKQQIHYSDNNDFSFFRADTLVISGRYLIEKDNGNPVVKYNTSYPPNQKVEFDNNDILILKDRCLDCYISTYKRKK